ARSNRRRIYSRRKAPKNLVALKTRRGFGASWPRYRACPDRATGDSAPHAHDVHLQDLRGGGRTSVVRRRFCRHASAGCHSRRQNPQGSQVGDIPIEQPNRFEFAVNLRTAKAIGIELPTAILLRADEVIE